MVAAEKPCSICAKHSEGAGSAVGKDLGLSGSEAVQQFLVSAAAALATWKAQLNLPAAWPTQSEGFKQILQYSCSIIALAVTVKYWATVSWVCVLFR